VKVLIDGENLRHQLAYILHEHGKLTGKNAYFSFDMQAFLSEALRSDAIEPLYYTTRIKQPREHVPVRLQKQIDAISGANRRWVADLTNGGVRVIKAGYLRVRESSACVHCGKKTLVLQEKGVDVRVATDLVTSSGADKQVVLVSSDSDLIPALETAKKSGVYTYYLCYAGWLNRSISSAAHKTITFDDALVLKHFRGKK